MVLPSFPCPVAACRTPRAAAAAAATLALVAALLTAPAPAAAEDDLASMSLASLLDTEIGGASKRQLSSSDTASYVTVITRADLRAHGWQTLGEALRSVAGTMPVTDGIYGYLGVRGRLSPGDYNTRILVLVDGLRLNDPLYDQAPIGGEFPIDLDLVERIEFIPGQGSAAHGSNALYAVVNVVTRRAGAEGTRGGAVTVDSQGLRQARATHSLALRDGASLLLSASVRRRLGGDVRVRGFEGDDEWRTSHGTDREHARELFLRYDDGELAATLIHGDRRQGLSGIDGTVFGDPRNVYEDRRTHVDVSWRQRLAPDTVWKTRLYAGNYRFLADYAVALEPLELNRDVSDARWRGIETTLAVDRYAGHRALLGADLQYVPRRDQWNGDRTGDRTVYLDDERSDRRYALFAEDHWALTPTLTVTGGLRLDAGSELDPQWSPRVGLVARPADHWLLRLQHGRAFRAPNAYESRYDVAWGYRGNTGLRPEQVRGTEVSVERRFGEQTRAVGTAYVEHSRQLIVQRLDPTDDRYVFENQGRGRGRGASLELEHIDAAGWRLRANVSVHQVRESGPEGSAGDTLRMAKLIGILPLYADWTAALDTAAFGSYAGRPAIALADLTFAGPVRVGPAPVRLMLGVANLLDRREPMPGGADGHPTLSSRDGRRFWLKVDVSY